MDLPYELLQHISTWLLPRYQCRLALTSKWCYLYLYNDLLKWHAQKAPIRLPKYKCIDICKDGKYIRISVSERRNKLILYDASIICDNMLSELVVNDLTNLLAIIFASDVPQTYELSNDDIQGIVSFVTCTGILTGCYTYMHKKCIVMHGWFSHPLLLLPADIRKHIFWYITKVDTNNFLCAIVGD